MDNARDGRWGRQSRVVALLAAACLMLAACGESGTRAPEIASAADARQGGIRSQGVVVTDSFRAYAGADEGFAAEAARDALNAGGNAVDAVVAGYFALAVTLPSAARGTESFAGSSLSRPPSVSRAPACRCRRAWPAISRRRASHHPAQCGSSPT